MHYRFLLFFLCSVNLALGQDLYVANDSYLYAKDVVLYVNNDIRLETPTSNLYLRGDAQLLQNADIKNSDAGELSIYQNQTTSIYEYNYFCSPVGVSLDGTIDNEDFNGSSNIHDPDDDTDLSNVASTPYTFTSAYNGTATQLSNYWIYTLKDAEGYWSWKQVFDTGAVEPGYGFTLKGSPNLNNILDFRGRPNNGAILVSCSFDGTDNQPTSGTPNVAETLTGNPYPSALDLKLFLANPDNISNLSGEIYFWEQKQKNSHYLADYEGGYGVYIPGPLGDLSDNGTYTSALFESYDGDGSSNGSTSGNTTDFSANNQRRYAAVGQGFVISSNVNGGFATFENSMRVYFAEDSHPSGNGSIFDKTENKKESLKAKKHPISHNGVDYKSIFENPTVVPEIKLHTQINNTFYKENVIAFRESTPNNNSYNKFYDGRNINDLSSDAYLISDGETLVIKSIKYDETLRIPFGLKAGNNNTLFRVKINQLNYVPDNVNVFVFDSENNTYTDIKNGTFEVTLKKGTHNNRFEITFAKNTLNTNETTSKNFKIYYDKNSAEIVVSNPNKIEIKNFVLFDISGKQVLNNFPEVRKAKYSYSAKRLSTGTYLATIKTANQSVVTKKIMVNSVGK